MNLVILMSHDHVEQARLMGLSCELVSKGIKHSVLILFTVYFFVVVVSPALVI